MFSGLRTTIESERLTLKVLEAENVTPAYVEWLNKTEVNQFLESRFIVQSKESVMFFVDKTFHSPDALLFGIFVGPEQLHIGNIKLGPVNINHSSSEIGFIIGDSSFWGFGYASEAILVLSSWAFSHLNIFKLTAGCYRENIGSKKALLRAGYFQEACLENQVLANSGRRQDLLRFCKFAAGH